MDFGTKGQITAKQILPLLRVVSELENTDFSNTSLHCDNQEVHYADEILSNSIVVISDFNGVIHESVDVGLIFSEERQLKKAKRSKKRMKNYTSQSNFNSKHSNKMPQMGDELPATKEGRQTYSANFNANKAPLYSQPKKAGRRISPKSDKYLRRNEDDLIQADIDVSHCMDEPLYEDPEDVLITKPSNTPLSKHKIKPIKNKVSSFTLDDRNHDYFQQGNTITKKRIENLKKRLSNKYKDLISNLIDTCDENYLKLNEAKIHIAKLTSKLKLLHQYNDQFGDENDRLRQDQEEIAALALDYKEQLVILQLQIQNKAEREIDSQKSVREPCNKCLENGDAIVMLGNTNSKLHQDVLMLKNVVYRLNIQLSRYQDKLGDTQVSSKQDEISKCQIRNLINKHAVFTWDPVQPDREMLSMPSLPHLSEDRIFPISDERENKEENNAGEPKMFEAHRPAGAALQVQTEDYHKMSNQDKEDDNTSSSKKLHLKRDFNWGDVNTHTLAPLLNAYQDSAAEREQLIHDYEKSFNRFTLKLKDVIKENNSTHTRLEEVTNRAVSAETDVARLTKERDDLIIETEKFKEKCSTVESRMREIQDVYEQKVAVMARDYEILHREYFEMKTRLAAFGMQTEQTSKKDKDKEEEYELKVAECKRLFEDLKKRYSEEKQSLERQIGDMERDRTAAFEKMASKMAETERHNADIKKLRKDLRLSKHLCSVLRLRLSAAKTSIDSYKRKWRRIKNAERNLNPPGDGTDAARAPTVREVQLASTLEKIRKEMKVVQKNAYKQLEAVDGRIRDQETYITSLQVKHASEMQKANILLEQKELMIENLLDKMSGYENIKDAKSGNQQVITSVPVLRNLQAKPGDDADVHESYFLLRERDKIMSRRNF